MILFYNAKMYSAKVHSAKGQKLKCRIEGFQNAKVRAIATRNNVHMARKEKYSGFWRLALWHYRIF